MHKKNTRGKQQKNAQTKNPMREFIKFFFSMIVVFLIIRATAIYSFTIPTSSMENTLLVGDFLLANKFVYGIRTPDWIGIPYTKIGFNIPYTRTPGFRNPRMGDVVIFKYPKDPALYYVKRCVAVSGDIVEIRNKVLYVNGEVFPEPPHSKFMDGHVYPKNISDPDIYPPYSGNRDNYGPIRVPEPGDTYYFTDKNRELWFERFQIIIHEGHHITLSQSNQKTPLTLENQNRWQTAIRLYPIEDFAINGQPLDGYTYTVKNHHYFMMGDNRDNSADSRYWGFLPERYIVGEALMIFFSWDKVIPFYRILDKVRWERLLTRVQ